MLTINIKVDIKSDTSVVAISSDPKKAPEIFSGNVKALDEFLKKFKINKITESLEIGGSDYDK